MYVISEYIYYINGLSFNKANLVMQTFVFHSDSDVIGVNMQSLLNIQYILHRIIPTTNACRYTAWYSYELNEYFCQDNFPTGNLQPNYENPENSNGMGGMKFTDVNAYQQK